MAPVSAIPEQGPLLLNVSDEHYNGDILGEAVGEDEVSVSQLSEDTVSSDSSRVLIQICVVTLLFDFTQYSVYAPLTEVFEDIICNNFYPAGSIHRDCKSIPVQSELALVKGYKDALNQIPSIVLGIPLGLLADRIGRKPLILLFLFGIFLSDSWVKIVALFPNQLPLRLVWLAPILKAVGGGANFGTSMFFTAVADIVEEKRRGDAFMKLSAMEMIVLVAGAPLISILMRINPWYPLGLSSVLLIVAGLIAMALPETHPEHRRASLKMCNSLQAQGLVSEINEETERPESHFETIRKLMPQAYASSRDLLKDPGVILSVAIFLLVAFGAHVWALLLQYVSHKFGWEFSTANLLFSLRGAITLLLSLIIMGAIDRFLQQKLDIVSAQKDLWLCTGSCILITVGVAVVGASQDPILMVAGVVISALGSSLLVSLRSAIISLFPQTPMAALNAVAGMAQSLGILISGPVLAKTYSWGLSQGGIWVGAPFLLASGLHFIALIDIFYLRVTRAPSQVPLAGES